MSLSGKVCVITGMSSGIGSAVALHFASLGAFIVGADVNVSAGEDTIAEVLAVSTAPTTHEGSNGYKRAAFVQCDVSKSPELQNLFQQAKARYGRIDIVCNNAGIAKMDENFFSGREGWKDILNINLSSVIEGTKLARQLMQQQEDLSNSDGPRGVIINTSSLASFFPSISSPVYAATKAGVAHLTRALKPLDKHDRIYVSAVCPGFINTKMGSTIPQSIIKSMQDMGVIVKVFEDLALDKHKQGSSVVRITKQRGVEYEARLQFVAAKL